MLLKPRARDSLLCHRNRRGHFNTLQRNRKAREERKPREGRKAFFCTISVLSAYSTGIKGLVLPEKQLTHTEAFKGFPDL